MSSTPNTMRALGVRKYAEPSNYEIIEFPVPKIENPNEVLVKVHAFAVSTGDTMIANGSFRFLASNSFPMKLSLEGAGTVVAVGSQVKHFKTGDEVYGIYFNRPTLPMKKDAGWSSEYSVTSENLLLPKPSHLSMVEAASLLASAVTAYQAFRRARELMGKEGGDLAGKTVYVPAGLSGVGSIGISMLKNVYAVGKIISTVSTPKLPLVEQYLPGLVDQLIDYKTEDPVKQIGKGTVDFVYNTQWELVKNFQLAKPDTGVLVSLTLGIDKKLAREVITPNLPLWAGWIFDLMGMYLNWQVRGTNVKWGMISGNPMVREDLEAVGEMIARRQILPVYTEVDFNDLDAVKRECAKTFAGKGGIGRLVVKVL